MGCFFKGKKQQQCGLFNLFFHLKIKNKRNGLVKECSYFIGNVLVQVRHIFLADYILVLPLLKLMGVGVFWNKKKKSDQNRRSSLNNSIDKYNN